ncbi:restriction endonuclease subunit S [Shewanella glacialipiscicola]|uniref:restriction endonuclease subunit S n=1 Tax=Shewanella glacialipiscicola TaxID=614069 RepID=UPI003D7AF0ED
MSCLIPEGWILSTVGEFAYNANGARKPISLSKRIELQGDFPYIGATGQIDSLNDFTHEGEHILVGEDGANLVTKSKNLAFIFDGKFWVNNHAHALKCLAEVPAKFLSNYINSLDLKPYVTGSAQPKLTKGNLEKIQVPLPPLAEQKVIADKLDELLAQVESTKARLDAIPAILKSFRQSVLAAAVSGKLTEEWRGDASYLASEHMEPWGWFGVPTSWDVQLYSELTDSRLGKMLDKGKNTGLPTNYLGNINVRWFDFELGNLQEILVSEKELLELKVQYNDVLICEGGEPGRCAIWKSKNNESIIYQKALHRALVDTKLLPEWLAYNLKNDADSLKLNQLFTGTTIKHLTGKALKRYPIRVPSIEEQTEIVRRVEELLAFADKVEAQVNAAQARVNNLTQSILAKAFRGELTADWRAANPELISGENSAEALLKRIQAERTKLKPTKKTKAE